MSWQALSVHALQPLDDRTKKELETVLKGFLEPKQVLKLDTKVDSCTTQCISCVCVCMHVCMSVHACAWIVVHNYST